jgi:hypothetical protein
MESEYINRRWEDYFQVSGKDFLPFWNNLLKNKKKDILMIIGLGFDPRTSIALKKIFDISGEGKRDVIILDFIRDEQQNIGRYKKLVSENQKEIEEYLKNRNYSVKKIIMRSPENHNVGGRNVTKIIDIKEIEEYTDIIVDISAMSRGIFFPLVSKLIAIIDSTNQIKNLHLVVAENPELDSTIKTEGLAERASYLHGFGSIEVEMYKDLPKVWIPILGEDKIDQIKILRENISPHETCPILPFPSADIRRGDKLVTEYKNILLDDLNIEMRNITYVHEQNAFQTYRIILNIIMRYHETFSLFRGCKTILSALSSKLLSIGVLLAAYELKVQKKVVGVLHVDSEDFNFELKDEQILDETVLYNLWITGEPYEL